MAAKPKVEYFVRETKDGFGLTKRYEVAKFADGATQPDNVYDVHYTRTSKYGFCNCPAGRRKGNNDKHVRLVRRWLAEGQPAGKLYTIDT